MHVINSRHVSQSPATALVSEAPKSIFKAVNILCPSSETLFSGQGLLIWKEIECVRLCGFGISKSL